MPTIVTCDQYDTKKKNQKPLTGKQKRKFCKLQAEIKLKTNNYL